MNSTNGTSTRCPEPLTFADLPTLSLPSEPEFIMVGHGGANQTSSQDAAFTACCSPGEARPVSSERWPGCYLWCAPPQRFFDAEPAYEGLSAAGVAVHAFEKCVRDSYNGTGPAGRTVARWPSSAARSLAWGDGAAGGGLRRTVFMTWAVAVALVMAPVRPAQTLQVDAYTQLRPLSVSPSRTMANNITNSTCPAPSTFPELALLAGLPPDDANLAVTHGANAFETRPFTTCCAPSRPWVVKGSACYIWCEVPQRYFDKPPPTGQSAGFAVATAFDACLRDNYPGTGEVGKASHRWKTGFGSAASRVGGGGSGLLKSFFAVRVAGAALRLLA
ncbi:hypothetical protein Micbo1qcDRAFT_180569 [Microdochium bolleyi]|uniref:Uncharacterized protein n=1 Tax=Microdochium bolleyi TaxID=196109 RepID=A0A136IL45_9PEZI|nr:hypothetical protein Micbo1qcDRAFT_180569 [Microdochium bolleyi]